MTTNNKLKSKKIQYGLSREVPKVYAFSTGDIDKYEYLTGNDMLLPGQNRQQNKLNLPTAHLLNYLFGKQVKKTGEEQEERQTKIAQILRLS